MVNNDMLETINAHKSVYVTPFPQEQAPLSLDAVKRTSTVAPDLANRIEAFIAAHLYPFTSGEAIQQIHEDVAKKAAQIAAKKKINDGDELKTLKEKLLTEAKKAARKEKPPMMKTLLQHLRKKDKKLSKNLDGKIQKYALHAYVQRAVTGLYTHLEIGNKVIINPEEEEPKTILKNALQPAIEYDFPSETVTDKALDKWIAVAFEDVNHKKRERKLRKIPSFFKEKRASTRTKKP